VPQAPAIAGFRLTSDWTISLPGWEGVVWRLVSYQLPDGKLIWILTDRFDLSAVSVAQLYKERWTIEHWWKGVKQISRSSVRSAKVSMPCRADRECLRHRLVVSRLHSSGFTNSLYEFVSNCQELSLVPLKELTNSALRRALETIFRLFDDTSGVKSPLQLAA